MKLDMHCHTKEGSLDAKVDIIKYIHALKERGFDGMLVTDHNSYRGYQKWADNINQKCGRDSFTVLKGVEYDTRDGGHMIAVLPDGISCRLLELRGLSVAKLEKIVHKLGGILGPAHPFDTGFYALMNNWWVKKNKSIIHKFDFIETFNSGTAQAMNWKAEQLAQKYKKPCLAGSDAHKLHLIGTAFTIFHNPIRNNDELISTIKKGHCIEVGSVPEIIPDPKKNIILKYLGIVGYWIYNKLGALFYYPARRNKLKKMT